MKIILIALLALTFAGCAGTKFSQQPPSQIPVNRTVKLNTANVWPLKMNGTYLQKITATAMGKQQTFSVHLTLDNWMIEAIAFNDVAGRLYSLRWTPDNVYWDGSPYIPNIIKPENILVDFLLAHLPVKQLQEILQGAQVYENGNQFGKTRIIQSNKVLRRISYSNLNGNIWGRLIIENPDIGYQLDIQTVAQ